MEVVPDGTCMVPSLGLFGSPGQFPLLGRSQGGVEVLWTLQSWGHRVPAELFQQMLVQCEQKTGTAAFHLLVVHGRIGLNSEGLGLPIPNSL